MVFGHNIQDGSMRIGNTIITICNTCERPLKKNYKSKNPHNCSSCNNWISKNDLKGKKIFK